MFAPPAQAAEVKDNPCSRERRREAGIFSVLNFAYAAKLLIIGKTG